MRITYKYKRKLCDKLKLFYVKLWFNNKKLYHIILVCLDCIGLIWKSDLKSDPIQAIFKK